MKDLYALGRRFAFNGARLVEHGRYMPSAIMIFREAEKPPFCDFMPVNTAADFSVSLAQEFLKEAIKDQGPELEAVGFFGVTVCTYFDTAGTASQKQEDKTVCVCIIADRYGCEYHWMWEISVNGAGVPELVPLTIDQIVETKDGLGLAGWDPAIDPKHFN